MDEGSDQAISKSFWRGAFLKSVIWMVILFMLRHIIGSSTRCPGTMETLASPLPTEAKACPKGKKDNWVMENGLVFFLFSRNVLMFVFFGKMYMGIVLAWLLDQLIGRS